MPIVYHLNCVTIVSPINSNVCGHCLLLKEEDKLVLIDTGIGLLDVQQPEVRIGKELIELVGYRFCEAQTAIRQIEQLGLNPKDVTDCVISHLDNDHIGGLADFPDAIVHLGKEELESYNANHPRYLRTPLAHNPIIRTYGETTHKWFGFEARKVNVSLKTELFLIPLFGHTLGHCGVALQVDGKWLLYVADAYYMRVELLGSAHPVSELAAMRADNNTLRVATLNQIRALVEAHPEISVFGYHDIEEFNCYTVER